MEILRAGALVVIFISPTVFVHNYYAHVLGRDKAIITNRSYHGFNFKSLTGLENDNLSYAPRTPINSLF